MKSYLIDCETCEARGASCDDCVMSFMADPEFGQPVILTQEERDALTVMADVGLIPPLRLAAG